MRTLHQVSRKNLAINSHHISFSCQGIHLVQSHAWQSEYS